MVFSYNNLHAQFIKANPHQSFHLQIHFKFQLIYQSFVNPIVIITAFIIKIIIVLSFIINIIIVRVSFVVIGIKVDISSIRKVMINFELDYYF